MVAEPSSLISPSKRAKGGKRRGIGLQKQGVQRAHGRGKLKKGGEEENCGGASCRKGPPFTGSSVSHRGLKKGKTRAKMIQRYESPRKKRVNLCRVLKLPQKGRKGCHPVELISSTAPKKVKWRGKFKRICIRRGKEKGSRKKRTATGENHVSKESETQKKKQRRRRKMRSLLSISQGEKKKRKKNRGKGSWVKRREATVKTDIHCPVDDGSVRGAGRKKNQRT